jgi:hypothetical protein
MKSLRHMGRPVYGPVGGRSGMADCLRPLGEAGLLTSVNFLASPDQAENNTPAPDPSAPQSRRSSGGYRVSLLYS